MSSREVFLRPRGFMMSLTTQLHSLWICSLTHPSSPGSIYLLYHFNITQTPFTAVATATMARWARQLLIQTGFPATGLKIHSARSNSKNASLNMGGKLETILRRIGCAIRIHFTNTIASLYRSRVNYLSDGPIITPTDQKSQCHNTSARKTPDYFSKCDPQKYPYPYPG